MHPIYNNPAYKKAIQDHEYAEKQISKWQNESYRAWKIITELEKEYDEKRFAANELKTNS